MNIKLQEKLKNSWASIFYEHVFCKIDEELFAVLYCRDNGRPNFPVNILLSLEFIKNLKQWTDEELFEQFSFNYQVMYALGLRNLGELYLAPRTIYEFRERVYTYTKEHPEKEELIFSQFIQLTKHFAKAASITLKEQRMDSTFITPNIKIAGRNSLAYDVLVKAIKALPAGILQEKFITITNSKTKQELLYRAKANEMDSKLQVLLDYGCELLLTIADKPELNDLAEIKLLKRFIEEQTTSKPEEKRRIAKEGKKLGSGILQSAHDPEATFRKKGNKKSTGYIVNIAETCSEENKVQLITDYAAEPNIKSDVEFIKDQLPGIKARTGLKELYTDGGYYGEDVLELAKSKQVKMHYTDMTGREANKIAVTEFEIENEEKIAKCPKGKTPIRSNIKDKVISAHFEVTDCLNCELYQTGKCLVKIQKKAAVVRISQKAITAARTRIQIKQERSSKQKKLRPAIEGTNSALKRARGLGRLMVTGKEKVKVVTGLKIIAHNFHQICRYFLDILKPGVTASVCS